MHQQRGNVITAGVETRVKDEGEHIPEDLAILWVSSMGQIFISSQ